MSFNFGDDNRFKENLELFLEAMEAEDAEMAAILRDNIDDLIAIVRGGERNLKARTAFNGKVIEALDALLDEEEDAECYDIISRV